MSPSNDLGYAGHSQQMLPGDLESDVTGGRLQELVPKAEEVARGLEPVGRLP